MTRRRFSALAVGTALAVMLPPAANAQATTAKEIKVKTPDGECDALFVHPARYPSCRADVAGHPQAPTCIP